MGAVEIIVIVLASALVLGVIGTFIYKKIKGLPTGECASCGMKGDKLLNEYRKKNKKNAKKIK